MFRLWPFRFLGLLFPLPAFASGVLYSVDIDSENLVTVETATGSVQIVGNTGADMHGISLTCAEGVLYGNNTFVDSHADLVQFDRSDGSILWSNRITVGGASVTLSEALASRGGALIAAFRSGSEPTKSNALGELSLSGELTQVVDYSTFDPTADVDALVARSDGHLLWLDATPGVNDYRFFDVTYDPPDASYDHLGTHQPYRAISGLAFTESEFWALDSINRQLLRLDPATGGILEIVPYQSTSQLRGLAFCPGLMGVDPLGWGVVKARYRR